MMNKNAFQGGGKKWPMAFTNTAFHTHTPLTSASLQLYNLTVRRCRWPSKSLTFRETPTQRLVESAFFFEAVEILRSGEYLLTAKPEDLLSRI